MLFLPNLFKSCNFIIFNFYVDNIICSPNSIFFMSSMPFFNNFNASSQTNIRLDLLETWNYPLDDHFFFKYDTFEISFNLQNLDFFFSINNFTDKTLKKINVDLSSNCLLKQKRKKQDFLC